MPLDETQLRNEPDGVAYEELSEILDDLSQIKKSVDEKTGELRAAIKRVIDDNGWHKGALAAIRAIDAMSETSRKDYLASFEQLFDVMMEGKWRQEARDLLDDLENADPDAEDE